MGSFVFDMATADRTNVRVEITEETLVRLLTAGQVCAADFRCLDCKSKQCLWRLCLKSCANHLTTGMGDRSARNGSCQNCGRCLKRGRGRRE